MTVLDKLLREYWYYTIEIAEGVFSHGGNHPNIVPTRHLLSKIDPNGAKVFDFGTMEAMVPILLSRRGANVTAVDVGDFTQKIEYLKQAYDVRFEYHPRVSLHNTKEFLRNKNIFEGFLQPSNPLRGFDMVVLSGVLYHVFNPLETMALARTLLRRGGLLVLETATSVRDEYAQFWNYNHGWLYPNGTNTWFLTARLLDHLLRFLRFKVIDVAYIENVNDVKRLAVIAQATDDLLVAPGEEQWFKATTRNFDYDFFCDLEYAQGNAKILPISDPLGPSFYHAGIDSVNVHLATMMKAPLTVDQDNVRLRLSDQV